jgi:hypothetical protein
MQVQSFHDYTRELEPVEIDPAAVVAVAKQTFQYGANYPKGCPVRQVWLVSGQWFFLHDDGTLLDQLRLHGAKV